MATAKSLLEELSADDTKSKSASGASLLADLTKDEPTLPQSPPPAAEMPWYRSWSTGFGDPVYGDAQLMQNVTHDKAMNVLRKSAASMVGAIPGASREVVEDIARPRSDEDINRIVRDRESAYQAERKAAGQEGMDWWRVGGAISNPMSWMGPSGAASTVGTAIKLGAKTGAFQALLQPVTSEGNFIIDKGLQMAIGGGAGGLASGTLSAALKGLAPAWRSGKEAFGRVFAGSDEAAKAAAATRVVDDTLTAAGADPAKVDPNLYSAIKQEVVDALKVGVDPDPAIMVNRADALALPVPVQLTRGQALRDPMQFAWEHRVAGQQGVGEPLSDLMKAQNRALIENLNELGARNALEPFDASQRLIKHIEGVDAAAKSKVDEAYKLVRDSAGRPARVSNEDFAQLSKNLLTDGRPEMAGLSSLADYLPETIAKQYNDIISGKLPLTVDIIQFLDRNWGGVQRGAADDTIKRAIGQLRTALNEAPVTDALGQEAMAAYQGARQLARQRFQMIEANPAYKAVVDGVEPDRFFQKYVAAANVSELAGLKQLIGAENTSMLQQTLIGNLKRMALNRASDENGTFSQAAYNKVLQDPVQGPRIRELFKDAPEVLGHLYRLGRVSENLIKIPAASKVNTSNTASATANIVRDVARSETGGLLSSMFPRIAGLSRVARDAGEKIQESQAVREAVTPGVSKPVAPRPKTGRLSDLLAKASSVGSMAVTREEEE